MGAARHQGVSAAPSPRRDHGYLAASQRPLTMLAFLLPLLIFHEAGAVLFFANQDGWDIERLRARKVLAGIFNAFGATGLFLPGLALIAVLLAWHIILRDRWRVRGTHLLAMAAETLAWTAPLLLFMGLVRLLFGGDAGAAMAMQPSAGESLLRMPLLGALTFAVGAGIFEELLFRMVIMAIVHFLAVDAAGLKDMTGRVLAAGVSTLIFALFHDPYLAEGGLDWGALPELLFAGIWFSTLYMARGFAIVAGTHALYDIVVTLLFHA